MKKLLIILLFPVAGISQSKTTTVLPTDIYSEYNLYGNRLDVTGRAAPSQIKMYCGSTREARLMERVRVKIKCDSTGNSEHPLVILNGCEINYSELKWISPSAIQSINVIKNVTAIKRYGMKAKLGAIEITSKSNSINFITKAEIITPTPKQ
jgi:hypothetical protein